MKKIKKILLLLILFLFVGIKEVYANYYEDKYDNLLSSNELTIYTDLEITDNNSLNSIIYSAIESSVYEYYNSQDDYLYYSFYPSSCDYSELTCDFRLMKYIASNGVSTGEEVKVYNNIRINIISDVSSYFSMVENDKLIINYDESMFASESEKEQYIFTYLSNLTENNNNNSVHYTYNPYNYYKYIMRRDMTNGDTTRIMLKKVTDVVFAYEEEPFSEDFKQLTSGTLTIKSDSEINKELLSNYLTFTNRGNYWFYVDGNIVNNKVFIGMRNNNTIIEKHLITIEQDTNIDLNAFADVGLGSIVNIPAVKPDTNALSYVNNYFSRTSVYINNADGTYENYNHVYLNAYDDFIIIQHIKRTNGGEMISIEFHKVNVNFVGYDNTYSDKFTEVIGNEIVVNGDSLDYNIINNSLTYPFSLLGCNDDYSVCDIIYYSEKTRTVEIHQVSIILNNEISDKFVEKFNIKEDNTIDIIMDDDITLRYNWFSYYYYDQTTDDSFQYSCSFDECNLSLQNYKKNTYESHTIKYNRISAEPSESYLALVKESIDIYPGENNLNSAFNNSSYLFAIDQNDNRVSTYSCDEFNATCAVMAINADRIVEMHNNRINIKEGKSPEFNELFPGNTLKINSIYKDDVDYIYGISNAYLMSKTRTWSYLSDFADGKAKVNYDGIEQHTMNIEFAPGNEEHQQIVDNIIINMGTQNIDFILEDLESVNAFYYGGVANMYNLNSKSIKESLDSMIKNDHISYSVSIEGGLGNPFYEQFGGRLVLFYDGIGYGIAHSFINVGFRKIIYIPDETEDTVEAYIAAAQKRIDDYLGADSGVVVDYSFTMEEDDIEIFDFLDSADIDSFDRNIYKLKYKDSEDSFLIIKDSSRIKDSTFIASDVNNNINVSSDNASYPLNTIVSSEKLDVEEYAEELDKCGVDNALIYDINLYSPTIGDIKDFNGTEFEVSIPIDKTLFDSTDLAAYYIDEEGNVEKHPVELGDYFGKFETGHFSKYIIAENNSETPEEPKQIPVYRMFNPINGEHLYTTDAYEVKVIYETQGWGFEGIGWYTSNMGTPVYRLYQPQLGNHLYTSDRHEIDVITSTMGWVMDFDGAPVMYSNGDIPIYRLFNPGLQGQHHLTTDHNEYVVIPMWGWQQEGISMNALAGGVPVTTYYYKDSKKPIDFNNITNNVLH